MMKLRAVANGQSRKRMSSSFGGVQSIFKLKILDRYLLREIFYPFLFGVFAFVIIGMVDILFTLVDLLVNSGVPLSVVFRLLIFKIPAVLVLFFPMAMLFAAMLTLLRMAKDSEITVFRAGGISLLRLIAPILISGVLAAGLAYYINETIVPWSNHVSDNLIRKAVLKQAPPEITANVFFQESRNRYFYIRQINQKGSDMEDVFVYELTGNFPRVITAKRAHFEQNQWNLRQGVVHQYDAAGYLQYEAGFEEMTIRAQADVAAFYSDQKSAREMSSGELKNKIDSLQKNGVNTKALSVDFYLKAATAFTNLVFVLVGICFCLTFVKSSRDMWGVIIAVLTALLSVGFYFFLTAMFRSLGRGGIVAPFWGAWAPNLIYTVLAAGLLFYVTQKE
jgi:lipopolysaccharide export system permease protein